MKTAFYLGRATLLAGIAIASSACGSAAKPGNFPTKAELVDLASGPPPSHLFGKGAVDAEKWEITGLILSTRTPP